MDAAVIRVALAAVFLALAACTAGGPQTVTVTERVTETVTEIVTETVTEDDVFSLDDLTPEQRAEIEALQDPVDECYEYDTFDEYSACLDRKLEELEGE